MELELDVGGRIGDSLVSVVVHGDFGLRDWRGELGVVHQNFAAFVDFAGFIKFFERPPDGFHKIFVHGAVAIVKIHPAADAVDGSAPSFGVRDHGFAGFYDVILKAPFGADVAAISNTKLFFYEVLGWEAMAVPTPTAFDAVALHGPVAWDGVFYDRAKECAVVRHASNKRRAVVKNVRFVNWPLFYGLFKSFVLFPPLCDGFFVF